MSCEEGLHYCPNCDRTIDFHAHQQAMQAAQEEIERLKAERDEARNALGDAAREIPMVGPVANRIRRLRTEHAQQLADQQAEIERLKAGGRK